MTQAIPFVTETKPGHFYFRRKINGEKIMLKLPDPKMPNFAAAYAAAKRYSERMKAQEISIIPLEHTEDPTFAVLVEEYRRSKEFAELSKDTQMDYERYMTLIERDWGTNEVSNLRASIVERKRDSMADRPGKANGWLKVLRQVLGLAVRRDYIEHNFAMAVGSLRLGEHLPWPDKVIERVLREASSQTTRLAIESALYSGQRISDVIRFTHKMLESDTIELVQHKRRAKGDRRVKVYIPVHPKWREAIARLEPRAETIIYDRSGRPFTSPEALQKRVNEIMRALGYVDPKTNKTIYHFHGLRKNSSNFLAEMGLTDQQIGAINGMTLETVRHYTKGVNKKLLAENARTAMHSIDIVARAKGY